MNAKKFLRVSLFFCCLAFPLINSDSNAQNQADNKATQKQIAKGGFKSINEANDASGGQLQTDVFISATRFLEDRGLMTKIGEGLYRTAINGIDATTYIFPIEGASRASLGAISISGSAATAALRSQFRNGTFDVEQYNRKYMPQNAQESVRWMIYVYQKQLPTVFYLEALRFSDDDEPVIVLTVPGGGKVIFNFEESLMYTLNPTDLSAVSFWDCIKQAFNIPASLNLLDLFVSICNLPSNCELRELVLAARSCISCPTILGCAVCVWNLADFLTCTAAEIIQCYRTVGDFSLSVTPNSQSITPGQSAYFLVAADFKDGFPGPVVGFSVSGLPSGAVASFTSGSITTPSEATTLIVTSNTNITTGTYQFTISARGGNTTKSVQASLTINAGNTGGGVTTISNGQTINDNVSKDQERHYKINVAGPVTQLSVSMTGTNDADLYVKYGSQASTSNWVCRPYESSTNEQCTFDNPSPGDWYIMVRGYSAANSSFTLITQYGTGGAAGTPQIDRILPLTTPIPGQQFFVQIDGVRFDPNTARVVVTGPGCPTFGPCEVSNGTLKQFGAVSSTRLGRVPLTLSAGNFQIYVQNGTSFRDPASQPFPFTLSNNNGGVGNLQISFSPNPAGRGAASNCGYTYNFTITIRETNGVGVNLTNLAVDGFPNVELSNVGFQTRVNANAQFSSNIQYCRGAGSSTWTITGSDDNGNTRTWSGTVQLQ